ncbi:PLP-dependent aminotransferase family protein [Limibaculum sp. FT325]|uniref:MocR-like pyridoxine biosynthesis transcription factor PdxR n=1 Tax=Thermohalobaculum sediminis TaxID=2939436 RepID=UPI0020BE58E8|nr:PLP-dependent aminotransferase family protein [Limibaculum sediminis]MCL5776951.1 PLP-dependent aminotransferase family protein [Limibaculum sediminis]
MLRATMRETLFHLERSQPATLQAQIREVLTGAIAAGRLKPGEPVPSTRAMAGQLGVSRNTVTLAYQALVSEGFLTARERSGYFVDPQAVDGMAARPEPAARGDGEGRGIDWRARLVEQCDDKRLVFRPADWQRHPFPFVYGQVDAQVFPIAEWRDCVRQAMGRRWLDAWTLDRYSEDDALLTEEIARRILPRRGISASPANVLVTLGAQNALYLIAALLVGRTTPVAMEEPGYPDLRLMLARRSDALRQVAVDQDGMTVDDTLDGASILFCTPSHHYPTTVTMSLERRRALLEKARREGLVIVEDDYEFEANYIGAPLPALKSLDEDGRVIYVGSFSKSLMPGLRLGFIAADEAVIAELRALRRLMLRHPPGNNQRAAALFLANGHFDVLVRRIHRTYRERWQVMAEAIEAHLPGWARSPGFGGSSYWLTGAEGLDAAALARRALERGVVIEPGEPFFARAGAGRRNFRMGFSSIPADRIPEGIARLRAACDAL